MINTEYDLKSAVPVELRMEIYREALHVLTNPRNRDDKRGNGLCLLLPCLLWGLDHFNNDGPNGYWDWRDTSIAFPEITEEYVQYMNYYCDSEKESDEYRIVYLKQIIEDYEKSIIC